MNIWRITGMVLLAGLALFLITLLLKLLFVAAATFLVVRVVGGRLVGRFNGPMGRVGWSNNHIISIDNPAYRMPVSRPQFDRVIPIG